MNDVYSYTSQSLPCNSAADSFQSVAREPPSKPSRSELGSSFEVHVYFWLLQFRFFFYCDPPCENAEHNREVMKKWITRKYKNRGSQKYSVCTGVPTKSRDNEGPFWGSVPNVWPLTLTLTPWPVKLNHLISGLEYFISQSLVKFLSFVCDISCEQTVCDALAVTDGLNPKA